MDAATVTAAVAVGGLVLGGGGLTGYLIAHRRLTTVEQPAAAAAAAKANADTAQVIATTPSDVLQLQAQTEKLRAEARSAEVQGVLTALQQVSALYTDALGQVDHLASDMTTVRAALSEVEDQIAAFRRAWSAAREAWGTHTVWDQAATPLLRQLDPDFPDPPPINLDPPPASSTDRPTHRADAEDTPQRPRQGLPSEP